MVRVMLDRDFSERRSGEKIRLFIASDYRLPRIALRQLINAAPGIEVVADAELDDALLQRVQQLSPDVILLDLTIPVADSLPVVSGLLKDTQTKVVIISASETSYNVRSMLAAGVFGYVLRRSGDTELLLAIRSAYQRRHFIDPQLGDVVADVLLHPIAKSRVSGEGNILSKRELQVLRAIARGFTSREIAQQFKLIQKTIETYRARIYEKLGLRTRADLVGYDITKVLLIDNHVSDELLM